MNAEYDAYLLVGPTASGKSGLALELARRFPVEIISVDSALVYRGMDIGTAKPSPEERSVCPHHLIDIRWVNEPYSAADFLADARRLIPEIRSRGRIPLLVGGTMLYAKAIRDGISEMPSTDPDVRRAVLEEGNRLGWPAMHEKLALVDPETAARLAPNDMQRIARALEVHRMTGRPISSFFSGRPEGLPRLRTLGLMPSDRARLHERIRMRFDEMLALGFLDEVRGLASRFDFVRESPAMRSVGYRQALEHLEGAADAKTFREKALAATRQLAKRQMTWMRSMEGTFLIDPFEEDAAGRMARDFEAAFPEMTAGA